MTDKSDWEISIYVPETVPAPAILPDDEASQHSLKSLVASFRRVTTVSAGAVQDQWNKTLDTLMNLSASIAQRSDKWKIDEIEVGFTLSAKGELLFIAEAGAEASIKFTLKPKTPDPGGAAGAAPADG